MFYNKNYLYIMKTNNDELEKNLQEIKSWKEKGKTTAILFGRFQPLHKGHIAMINAVLESGLDLHIFIKSDVDSENGKNPFSVEQRKKMFKKALPNIPAENLHSINFNLDAGDNKSGNFENLIKSSKEVAFLASHIKDGVVFYGRKEEDIKDYVIFGSKFNNLHYTDILKKIGYDTQEVIHPLGHGVSGANFRDGIETHILPDNLDYIKAQEILAERNNRSVGGSKEGDAPIVDGTTADGKMDIGKFQGLMLQEMKKVIIPVIRTK